MSDPLKISKGLQRLINEARERRKPKVVQLWNKYRQKIEKKLKKKS
jgi:hypothetical protein